MRGTQTPGLSKGEGNSAGGQSPTHSIKAPGCIVSMRRVRGPDAHELFIHCQPDGKIIDAGHQAEAIYRALLTSLNEAGGTVASIVSETVFHQDLERNLNAVREARRSVLGSEYDVAASRAAIEIEQSPVDEHARLELQVHAVMPVEPASPGTMISRPHTCDCVECGRARGMAVQLADQSRFYSGVLYGKGDTAYQQTHDLFSAAEDMLHDAGMTFKDVVRTWIYLEHMERDYPDLNRARREFFNRRNIDPPPASTGIGAGLVPKEHDLCMTVFARKGDQSVTRTLMTTPTLNEAPQYGADFSRGMCISDANSDTLYVSGTASINEAGQSVHDGDFDAQVDRMLMNVSTLLKEQGADFTDIVSATTYVKNSEDAGRLRQKLEQAGYVGFPNALVVGPVCRPELLCETEALAIVDK